MCNAVHPGLAHIAM